MFTVSRVCEGFKVRQTWKRRIKRIKKKKEEEKEEEAEEEEKGTAKPLESASWQRVKRNMRIPLLIILVLASRSFLSAVITHV